MSEPMQPYDAVIYVLEQMRPGGLLAGFALVAVRPVYNEYSGHMIDMLDTNDPDKHYYSVNTADFVMRDADWNQSQARLLMTLAGLRSNVN